MAEIWEFLGDTVRAWTSGEVWQQFLDDWIVLQVIVVLVALGLAAVPVWWLVTRTSTARRKRTWRRTVGTVVGFDTHEHVRRDNSSRYTYTYTLKYEYEDAHGRTQQGRTTRDDEPELGQELVVYVNPLQGTKVIAPRDDELKPTGLIAEMVGYLVFVACVLVAIRVFLDA